MVHLDKEAEAPHFPGLNIALPGQKAFHFLLVPVQKIGFILDPRQFKDPGGQCMKIIYKRTHSRDLVQHFFRKKFRQDLFVPGPPEVDNGFNEINNEVGAFHMTLFAQEMDEDIFSLMNFIDFS